MIQKFAIAMFVLTLFQWSLETNANAICVDNYRANLRKGPGVQYQKLWEVYKYMPFKMLRRKGDWLHVQDMDGDRYWIHKKLISSAYKCAVIKKDDTNMREGPGTTYPVTSWSPVKKFFSFKILDTKGDWAYTVDETGDKAWVHLSLIWIQ
ncbi:MAG: hypothetical protein COV66_03605 [Nitrospinae bacterium CG11_big_fil_rev_8_21_14_0_20_45_15]|nr:MAG: hypothetical protein COV66_03605 [Nitrospinae bacterium CG11_big_fil_rev_8_21_14_0_20_45_15]